MGIIQKIKDKIRYKIICLTEPQMIYGYLRYDGVLLDNTRISNTTFIDSKDKFYIEGNVFIAHYNILDASHGLTIKEGCQIASFNSIITHSSHISIRLYGKEYQKHNNLIGYKKGPIYIGEYTFIGPHCVIMPETKIGKGCIVSAYSFVQGQFPDYSIISGNPAKIVGDTRRIDERYLKEYPELSSYYYDKPER